MPLIGSRYQARPEITKRRGSSLEAGPRLILEGGKVKSKLLTEKDLEAWLKISVATLRTWRSRPGRDPIPFTKIGGAVRYREDLVLKWLERNTFDSTEQGRERN